MNLCDDLKDTSYGRLIIKVLSFQNIRFSLHDNNRLIPVAVLSVVEIFTSSEAMNDIY